MRRFLKFIALGTVASIPFLAIPCTHGAEHSFIGSNKCRVCHIREYRSWAETKMAKALDVLKPGERADVKKAAKLDPNKDYTKDATCLPCHTVGYGKKGGFVDLQTTPDRAGVGCEMCHGPGGTYVQDQYMSLKNKNYKKADLVAVGLIGEITAATCDQCHNPKNPTAGPGYKFNFEEKKTQDMHEIYPLKYQHK